MFIFELTEKTSQDSTQYVNFVDALSSAKSFVLGERQCHETLFA